MTYSFDACATVTVCISTVTVWQLLVKTRLAFAVAPPLRPAGPVAPWGPPPSPRSARVHRIFTSVGRQDSIEPASCRVPEIRLPTDGEEVPDDVDVATADP